MIKFINKFTEEEVKRTLNYLNHIRKDNIFNTFISILIPGSKHVYGLHLNRGGGRIMNLNVIEDERLLKLGVIKKEHPYLLPPAGLDAYIEVDIDMKWYDFDTKTHLVSNYNIIFHELVEAYMMLDSMMDYKPAHNYAGWLEISVFMLEFPLLSHYPASGILTSKDSKYVIS